MDLEEKAATLLREWQQYKCLHYSQKTNFANAVDIEIEKDAVGQWATYLIEGLTTSDVLESERQFRFNMFEQHLTVLKDRITFELLRNGN